MYVYIRFSCALDARREAAKKYIGTRGKVSDSKGKRKPIFFFESRGVTRVQKEREIYIARVKKAEAGDATRQKGGKSEIDRVGAARDRKKRMQRNKEYIARRTF